MAGRKLLWVVTTFVSGMLVAAPARALVTGTVVGPGGVAVPIAVVGFVAEGAASQAARRFTDVLARDLDLSGLFRVLDPASFPERPPNVSLGAADTDFEAWEATGAVLVVKGRVDLVGGQVRVEARTFDVAGRRGVEAASRRFDGTPGDAGRMANRLADAIVEHLTGLAGPFDSQIVFTSTRGGPLKDLYRFTFDGGAQRLTHEPSLSVSPRFHPDRTRVIFMSYRRHAPSLFELLLANGSVRQVTTSRASLLGGAWSPDGSTLIVAREQGGNTDLYLVDRSGKPLRRLTDHWAVDVSPAWSPDGRRFAFCSARSGSPQIYVMNVDGSGLRRISSEGSYNTSPAWSPTGEHLAWASRAGGMQIVVSDVEGRGARRVTTGGDNEDPAWAPDGRFLAYSGRGTRGRRLMLTDRDGRTHRELTAGPGDDTSPTWARWP
jgi:TolB protein